MKPIVVTRTVPQPIEVVYDHLDDLGAHEAFTDHLLKDWTLSGPRTGVGAKARCRGAVPGPADWLEIEVLEAERPTRIMERTIGANGKRVSTGTYDLEPAGEGATIVTFTLHFTAVPMPERVLAPLVHAFIRRGNARALERLEGVLAQPA